METSNTPKELSKLKSVWPLCFMDFTHFVLFEADRYKQYAA